MTPDQLASIQAWLQYVPIIATAILFVLIVWTIKRIIGSDKNKLEFSDLIASKGIDGREHPDWDKIGKGGGVIVCVAIPFIYVYNPNVEPLGLAAIMAASLLFLGGVSAYAATLKSRQGTVETTKTAEVDAVSRTTETRIQTPPIEGNAP